jgi:hypothetical protein
MNELEHINTKLSSIDVTLAVQAETLKRQEETLIDHTARSMANEARIKQVEDAWLVHMAKLSGVMNFFKGIMLLAGLASVIIQIIWRTY